MQAASVRWPSFHRHRNAVRREAESIHLISTMRPEIREILPQTHRYDQIRPPEPAACAAIGWVNFVSVKWSAGESRSNLLTRFLRMISSLKSITEVENMAMTERETKGFALCRKLFPEIDIMQLTDDMLSALSQPAVDGIGYHIKRELFHFIEATDNSVSSGRQDLIDRVMAIDDERVLEECDGLDELPSGSPENVEDIVATATDGGNFTTRQAKAFTVFYIAGMLKRDIEDFARSEICYEARDFSAITHRDTSRIACSLEMLREVEQLSLRQEGALKVTHVGARLNAALGLAYSALAYAERGNMYMARDYVRAAEKIRRPDLDLVSWQSDEEHEALEFFEKALKSTALVLQTVRKSGPTGYENAWSALFSAASGAIEGAGKLGVELGSSSSRHAA